MKKPLLIPGSLSFFISGDSVARHLTLRLAPIRGEIYREHPEQMNSQQVEPDDKHQC